VDAILVVNAESSSIMPGTLRVACFDTAFHRGHPQVADGGWRVTAGLMVATFGVLVASRARHLKAYALVGALT
jgi:hypothetical protein